MKRLRGDETGVAMVTVLFVGAALTAVASLAAFTTIREFKAGTDDRRSGRALAFAEAGVDRMISYLKSGEKGWNDISLAGCSAAVSPDGKNHPALVIPGGGEARLGTGSYLVRLEVFNPFTTDPAKRFAPGACNDPAFPRYYASPRTPTDAPQYFAIKSVGATGTSAAPCPAVTGGGCRTVRQVLAVKGFGFPIGLYSKLGVGANGTVNLQDISLSTAGDVTGRQKISVSGTDKYYKLADFGWDSMTNANSTFAPAAIHSLKSIQLLNTLQSQGFEHTTGAPLNCTANGVQGASAQSQWDQSGTGFGGPIPSGTPKCASWLGSPAGPPPTSELKSLAKVAGNAQLSPEDYEALKQTADSRGIYCKIGATTRSCTRSGSSWTLPLTNLVTDTHLTTASPALPRVLVAYFEFDSTTVTAANEIKWSASWDPCNDDPAVNKTIVLIIRNGSLNVSGATKLHGGILVPEGSFSGNPAAASIDGTVFAERFDLTGGFTFKMSDCALRGLNTAFLDFTPYSWTEVDR